MGLLTELVSILGRHKLKRIEVIGNPGENTGKLYDLYNGLQSGLFESEEAAAQAIYNASASDRRFQKLKNKLKARLVNSLMFVDPNQPRFNEASVARFNCLKLFTAQQMINFYMGSQSSGELHVKVLKEAEKYGINYLALETSRGIRKRAVIKGDVKLLAEINKKIRYYQKVIEAECMAEEFYYDVGMAFSRSRGIQSQLLEEAIEREKELRPYVDQYNTPFLTYYGYHFFALRYMLGKDYASSVRECQMALDKMESSQNSLDIHRFSLMFRMLQCHVQLRNYEEGEKVVQQCLKFTETGSVYNHFITREMHFLLNLHTEKYQKGYAVYLEAINSPKYRLLNSQLKENWKIYGAFVQYLIEIGIVETEGESERKTKFRLGKFLNEVPNYSKDKRGLNIPILIIQTLFLLHRRRFNDVIDRTEALNTYVYRYLKKDENYRSNCFVKMILTLPQADFHKQGVIRKANKYYQKLLAEPLELSGESSEIEIIPYEKLWEMILDSLEDKFQKSGKRY